MHHAPPPRHVVPLLGVTGCVWVGVLLGSPRRPVADDDDDDDEEEDEEDEDEDEDEEMETFPIALVASSVLAALASHSTSECVGSRPCLGPTGFRSLSGFGMEGCGHVGLGACAVVRLGLGFRMRGAWWDSRTPFMPLSWLV
jgi:hypothetical protein